MDASPTYQLRPADPADREWVRVLHRTTLGPYVEQTFGWDDIEQRKLFDDYYARRSPAIVTVGGEDVGLLDARETDDEIFLALLLIDAARQRRGIGTRIVTDLCSRGRASGVPVRLKVLRVNPARRLYERLGFVDEEATDTHVRMCYEGPTS